MQPCYLSLAKSIGAPLADQTGQQTNTPPAGGRQTIPIPGAYSLINRDDDAGDLMLQRQFCKAIIKLAVSSLEDVNCFIARGVNLNSPHTLGDIRGGQPLHWAAIAGNARAIEALIASEQLVDINATYCEGFTPLALVCGAQGLQTCFPDGINPPFCSRDEEEVARNESLRILLRNGADPRLTDNQQRTALHHAAENDWADLIATLLGFPDTIVDINVRDKHGNTPLHKAASMGHFASVSLLLKHGAEPNAVNKHMQTPLHQLCISAPDDDPQHHCTASGDAAIKLLDAGARLDLLDRKSKRKPSNTPIGHALERGKNFLADRLFSYSSKQASKNHLQPERNVLHARQAATEKVQVSEVPQTKGSEQQENRQQACNSASPSMSLFLPD